MPIAPSPWTSFDRIASITFAFIIGGLVAWSRYTKKNMEAEKARYLKRVAEIADKTDRVFGAMREEFGDLLLQIVLNAQIASQEGEFTANDVLKGIYAEEQKWLKVRSA